jgi:hypothetical protein
MGVSTSRPSYVSEALVRKRKTSSLPAFETEDASVACNNKKARRRRSNEDDSPHPAGTPPLNEHVEAFEDGPFEDSQQFTGQVVAEHRTDYPSLRDSNKGSPISDLTPVTPLLHEPIGNYAEDTRSSFQHEIRGDPPSTEADPILAAPLPSLPPGTITKTRITTTTVTTTSITTPDGETTFNTSTTSNTTNLIH